MITDDKITYVFVYCDLCGVRHRAQQLLGGQKATDGVIAEAAIASLPVGWSLMPLARHSYRGDEPSVTDAWFHHICPDCSVKVHKAQVTP